MPQMVLTGGQGGTTRRGLRDYFANAYDTAVEGTKENLEPVMAMDLPSDTDQEFYAYFKDAPFPRFHPAGENMAKAGFSAVQFSVLNYDYSLEVEWLKNNEKDDQLKMVRSRAGEVGTNFAYRFTDAFFDILLSTTTFLPSTLTAPDGAAIFATTAGGSDRFGATSGNLLTGTGVATAGAIRTDIFTAMEQFGLFQNTQGKPLFPKAILEQGYIVYAGQANEQIFSEAFYQNPTSLAASSATSNASVENIFIAAGKKVELRFTQHITDNDYYIFARGVPHKPIFHQLREPIEEAYHDEMTSAEHARAKSRSLMYTCRDGYGLFLPYGVIKINN